MCVHQTLHNHCPEVKMDPGGTITASQCIPNIVPCISKPLFLYLILLKIYYFSYNNYLRNNFVWHNSLFHGTTYHKNNKEEKEVEGNNLVIYHLECFCQICNL